MPRARATRTGRGSARALGAGEAGVAFSRDSIEMLSLPEYMNRSVRSTPSDVNAFGSTTRLSLPDCSRLRKNGDLRGKLQSGGQLWTPLRV